MKNLGDHRTGVARGAGWRSGHLGVDAVPRWWRLKRWKASWLEDLALDGRLLRADDRCRRPDCARIPEFPLATDEY